MGISKDRVEEIKREVEATPKEKARAEHDAKHTKITNSEGKPLDPLNVANDELFKFIHKDSKRIAGALIDAAKRERGEGKGPLLTSSFNAVLLNGMQAKNSDDPAMAAATAEGHKGARAVLARADAIATAQRIYPNAAELPKITNLAEYAASIPTSPEQKNQIAAVQPAALAPRAESSGAAGKAAEISAKPTAPTQANSIALAMPALAAPAPRAESKLGAAGRAADPSTTPTAPTQATPIALVMPAFAALAPRAESKLGAAGKAAPQQAVTHSSIIPAAEAAAPASPSVKPTAATAPAAAVPAPATPAPAAIGGIKVKPEVTLTDIADSRDTDMKKARAAARKALGGKASDMDVLNVLAIGMAQKSEITDINVIKKDATIKKLTPDEVTKLVSDLKAAQKIDDKGHLVLRKNETKIVEIFAPKTPAAQPGATTPTR